MKKKIIAVATSVGLFLTTSVVYADVTLPNPLGSVNDFGTLLGNIASGVGKLIASLGVIMIIVSGILYLLSAGSPDKVATAKKALIYAVAGIVIGIAATAIVSIITTTLQGH